MKGAGALTASRWAAAQRDGHAYRIWFDRPAERWIDALPVGNGRMGAMVHGGVEREVIQLNEQTLWAGRRFEQDGAAFRDALPKVRELLFAGKYDEANVLAAKTLVGQWDQSWYGTYQTLGDLVIETDHSKPSRYQRELSLDEGIARVTYDLNGVTHRRSVFASRPGQVIVVRFESPTAMNLRLSILREQCSIRGDEGGFAWSGKAPGGGVEWRAECRVHALGARVRVNGHSLHVDGAREVLLIIDAHTDYFRSREDRQRPAPRSAPDYSAIEKQHITAHRAQFGRVSLDLGGWDKAAIPNDKRIEAVRKGGEDPQLAALYFQYGRYLLMSSSQPGGLPANLQGLWNQRLDPPWQSDYHININIPMNYWPAEVANLSECHEPLFDFAERLRAAGQRVARDFYGARGSVVHYTTNVWGYAEPGHALIFGLWQDGLGWLCRHIWQRYEFSADRAFLRRFWPVLRDAALFYCDLLREDPATRKLVPGPAASPENTYKTASGKRGWIAMGTTTANQTVRDVFETTIAGARDLGINDPVVAEVLAKLPRLPPPVKVGRHGQIMEWPEDFEENEPGHRHVSHLYALHPLSLIDQRNTPDWARAARVTLDRRLAAGGGQTGWSAAWMVNLFARLEDGERAHEILYRLLRHSTEPNLFDTHPSAGGPIFQIDGNFGGSAGISEMLLQSHQQEVSLLPALPPAWRTGHVRGLRARGGYTVDIEWAGGKLKRAVLKADRAGSVKVRTGKAPSDVLSRKHAAGESIEIRGG